MEWDAKEVLFTSAERPSGCYAGRFCPGPSSTCPSLHDPSPLLLPAVTFSTRDTQDTHLLSLILYHSSHVLPKQALLQPGSPFKTLSHLPLPHATFPSRATHARHAFSHTHYHSSYVLSKPILNLAFHSSLSLLSHSLHVVTQDPPSQDSPCSPLSHTPYHSFHVQSPTCSSRRYTPFHIALSWWNSHSLKYCFIFVLVPLFLPPLPPYTSLSKHPLPFPFVTLSKFLPLLFPPLS